MTVLTELGLQIKLPKGVAGRKFDDESHGLTHCMKAVDFIVETHDQLLFIELKDPERPDVPAANMDSFLIEFLSGQLDSVLKTKFRDSWLYEHAAGRVNKPITYLVLIGASSLTSAELLRRTEALKRQLPVLGPKGQPWAKPFVAACAVMNLAAWNKTLALFPASRVGQLKP
jgi:hypothetical protein